MPKDSPFHNESLSGHILTIINKHANVCWKIRDKMEKMPSKTGFQHPSASGPCFSLLKCKPFRTSDIETIFFAQWSRIDLRRCNDASCWWTLRSWEYRVWSVSEDTIALTYNRMNNDHENNAYIRMSDFVGPKQFQSSINLHGGSSYTEDRVCIHI